MSQSIDASRLGFLSGAPRVSTSPRAEAQGPRAHVLGVIGGFESLGWTVRPYIVGDRIPSTISRSKHAVIGSRFTALAADLARLATRQVSEIRAWRELRREVDWVYERLASFQAMG